jgi:hypothetical protein
MHPKTAENVSVQSCFRSDAKWTSRLYSAQGRGTRARPAVFRTKQVAEQSSGPDR